MDFSFRHTNASILGVNVHVKKKHGALTSRDQLFQKPIIHKEIQGDKIIVPLNLERAWNHSLK